jgi:hypothetical protein
MRDSRSLLYIKKNNLKIFVENEKKIIFPNRFDILMLKIIFKK